MDSHPLSSIATAGPGIDKSSAAVIMIHGRNAAPRNILGLVPRLDRPRFTYLAPAAANNSWYPLSFLAEIEKNEPYLSTALEQLRALVNDIVTAGVPIQRVVLLGFSQGACLAAEFASRHPTRYGGIVLFSGGLIGPPGTVWNTGGSFGGTPVFFGCSDVDSHVPQDRVLESAEVFTRMGADVTARIYPGMGHVIADDEIAWAQRILDSVETV